MYTLKELARQVGGTVLGDPEIRIRRIQPFESAEPGDLTLAALPRLLNQIEKTKASAVIVPPGVESTHKSLLQCRNPKLAFARILRLYHLKPFQAAGISQLVSIGEGCRISKAVSIHPFVTIGEGTVIEDRVTIMQGTVIGGNCRIGEGCTLYPNVTLYPKTSLGRNVIIHSGTVIGADGFGYVFDGERHLKIPQSGSVVIEDEVEIGANSCIDRATFGCTRIGKGVKLDNHVHIGHNCTIGENTIIVGSVGISGSVEIGRDCLFAGQSGAADHVKIGDNVTVMAKTAVTRDVPSGSRISGIHGRDHRHQMKIEAILQKLPEIYRDWKTMKSRLNALDVEKTEDRGK